MPEDDPGPANGGCGFVESEDIIDLLPLQLVRSQLIPPAPNRRESAIDWLPDFGGASWIAYGASSLLVISHLPSPVSGHEAQPGPFFRQVIGPPTENEPADLSAVAWCPAQPSDGEIACALGSSIFIYSPVPAIESGSFYWRQTMCIASISRVGAICWTGSGDGLIVGCTEVVLWIRKSNSWEMAWKVNAEVPQSLVSATLFAEGLVASAIQAMVQDDESVAKGFFSSVLEESKHVLVYHADAKFGVLKLLLYHPQPVVMIQWRPFAGMQLQNNAFPACRDVLMTCCLDGTVRLWSEIDNGRPRKSTKDMHDQKSMRRLFHVVAVIEMNQSLNGILGRNLYVKWALESGGIIFKCKDDEYYLSSPCTEQEQIGKCEWLISVGPNFSLTFWAIHCLDDLSPLRFPRVTMWKQIDLINSKESSSLHFNFSSTEGQVILVKIVSSRSRHFGPPLLCSLLQLLPDNSVSWLQLYSPSENIEDKSLNEINKERSLSCIAGSALCGHGHSGRIIQVAVHPYRRDIELAVSLDSNGLLLFWSLSTLSESMLGVCMHIHPLWKFLDQISLQVLSPHCKFSGLVWAPSVLDENRFLLVSHEDGIDCFMIEVSCDGERILSHKLMTIPFSGHTNRVSPPDQMFATPLASNFGHSSCFHSFLLLCVWRTNFKPLSWKVSLCMSGSNDGFSSKSEAISEDGKCVSSTGKTYYAAFYRQSFDLPASICGDEITTVAVVSPSNVILTTEQTSSSGFSHFGYHMATGHSDGTIKLWSVSHVQSEHDSDTEYVPWKLVGHFTAHESPVRAVSLSSFGSKIATTSFCGPRNSTCLHIWEPLKLTSNGSFLLEDAIVLQGTVIALSWLTIGNGQILLGVCLPNELRIYLQKRSSHSFIHSDKSKEMQIWYCIAVTSSLTAIRDFIWGPKLTAVLVHEKHFSVFSQWLLRTNTASNDVVTYVGASHGNLLSADSIDKNTFSSEEPLKTGFSQKIFQQDYAPNIRNRLFSIIDISDKLNGTLALYHSEALVQHIFSGNWNRACIILKHFVDCICSNESSTAIQRSNRSGSSSDVSEVLSRYFEDTHSVNLSTEKLFWGQSTSLREPNFHLQGNSFQLLDSSLETNAPERFSVNSNKSGIMDLIDTLEKSHGIANITTLEKTKLLVILDLLNEIRDAKTTSAYGNLDEAGRRFWVAVRFQYLDSLRKGTRMIAEKLAINSRLAAWAFQSDCQDDLLSSVLSAEPSWLEMRNLGVGLWYTNMSQLRTRMEKLARTQYLKNKNAKECALLYLALNRLHVLAGLFKISKDEKDKVLFGFLSRNFQEEKNKAAALKNAYVLMGRHELELAIAFFLLGGDPSSAVTVCAKNLRDEQLALVICRLLEGFGGPLERQLISNFLLPNALEKGDCWLSSILEWTLGNYSQSVERLLGAQIKQVNNSSIALGNYAALSDPDIGRYCMILATRNSFRCSVGEAVAATLSRLSAFLAAYALNRCGIPLEALECLSSLSIEGKEHKNMKDVGNHEIFHGILSYSGDTCNWLLENTARYLELNAKINMALRYISSILRNHPRWPCINLSKCREVISCKYFNHKDEELEQLKHDLNMIISILERKFLLKSVDILNLILLFAHNSGALFLGLVLVDVNAFLQDEDNHHILDLIVAPASVRLLFMATQEISSFLANFVMSFKFTDTVLKPDFDSHDQLNPNLLCLKRILYFIRIFRFFSSSVQEKYVTEDLPTSFCLSFDLLEVYVNLASACIGRNIKGLILMIHPILYGLVNNDPSSFEIVCGKLKNILHQNSQLIVDDASNNEVVPESIFQQKHLESIFQQKHLEVGDFPIEEEIEEDEKWQLLETCLWLHVLNFTKQGLNKFSTTGVHNNERNMNNMATLFDSAIANLLINSLTYVSSSLVKLVASYLRQKALKGSRANCIIWLDELVAQSNSLHHFPSQRIDSLQLPDDERLTSLDMLWDISFCPDDICEYFVKEKVNSFPYYHQNLFDSWKDVQRNVSFENENVDSNDKEDEKIAVSAHYEEVKSGHVGRILNNDGLVETRKKHPGPSRDIMYFHNPKEVMKRSGELFEAICFNSINEHEVALASNKKGLIFFNLKSEKYFRGQADYIWSESDWPQDGWAGCESTPVPTYVSQGIGLGCKRGTHLGLGGATIGIGSLARPGRDLTGGGAFGIPGYAGIGASGLGWGEEQDFEEFRDPPATVENIHSRALTPHPSMPFLLVGSRNTHVYLWEFGKDKATATYGVLPAANVPPPYALASISAVQFDHYGHRFATAALDGTVCTWQLEVGGRSNVHPTDSSHCFSNHASDVAYVATSGSILAAAGWSTSGVNVVLWDTLAPPATCQASLFCHEGGARSISVFDNDIGTGSISPIIVTGGKSGDVGLHDLRYIATGKTRRNRHASEQDLKTMHDTNLGVYKYGENSNGMIWYIPKAHLGSVTSIKTIPNTSLFLTGSKDGDVKLWDAKRSQLVFHWQKLHDRHTFLQPNSRSFGGVVRAAVTDIQVFSHGFLTCGGDGSVKIVHLK